MSRPTHPPPLFACSRVRSSSCLPTPSASQPAGPATAPMSAWQHVQPALQPATLLQAALVPNLPAAAACWSS